MTQEERRIYLLKELLMEQTQYADIMIPEEEQAQRQLLRALFNIRMPQITDRRFLDIQDAYLQEEIRQKGITDIAELTPLKDGIYLWRGDITTLRCDAIVNAANSQMLGCFCPNHGCIDNAIHTYSGVQLRAACAEIMDRQGHEERTGEAEITSAYNLPCKYVLHTVGPVIHGRVTDRDKELLASCYRSCMELAERNGAQNIAFCCISTGEIAVKTVQKYRRQTNSGMEVIFNVFKETDYNIYRKLLVTD